MCEEDDDCCCSREISDRLFVVAVVSLIGFCFFCYWYLIVVPWKWLAQPTLVSLLNVVGLHVSFILLCTSYYKTMKTSPGKVDKGWTPSDMSVEELRMIKDSDQNFNIKKQDYIDIDYFYQPKWCKVCENWKPPRSHHCKDINVCVLKLDHYCPWVYNAVGYRNHKFFILFLFYASAALTYFLICCITRVIYDVTYRQRGKMVFTIPEVVLFLIQLVLTLPVTIGIISLFCYQISCLVSNTTNIETFVLKRYKRGAKKYGINYKWFYDFGTLHNVRQVMGPSVKEWFLPILPEHVKNGSGMEWKTRHFELKEVSRDNMEGNHEEIGGLHKRQTKSLTDD